MRNLPLPLPQRLEPLEFKIQGILQRRFGLLRITLNIHLIQIEATAPALLAATVAANLFMKHVIQKPVRAIKRLVAAGTREFGVLAELGFEMGLE